MFWVVNRKIVGLVHRKKKKRENEFGRNRQERENAAARSQGGESQTIGGGRRKENVSRKLKGHVLQFIENIASKHARYLPFFVTVGNV